MSAVLQDRPHKILMLLFVGFFVLDCSVAEDDVDVGSRLEFFLLEGAGELQESTALYEFGAGEIEIEASLEER